MNAEKLFKWRVRGRRLEEVVLGLETKDRGNIEVERWMLSTSYKLPFAQRWLAGGYAG